jgi:large subunit ribosomal protein L13
MTLSRSTQSFTPADVERRWFVVDLEGQVLGRAATRIANVLRGKHKPTYTPHADTGDFVVVVNASKVVLTGAKLDSKMYRTHSQYIGGLKETPARQMIAEKSDEAVRRAVRGMMPKGPLGRSMLRKLKVYAGADHPHAAQEPQTLDLQQEN